ncbi:hypothetical protein [Cellulomonas taurus]|uniref:hypothetical protein n=1 Tax=Cellulomonas taurus TaxID=2729175 RepID=UPI00145CAC4B|nr:hypothetical protein [Cellulomonas taurus]
MALTPFKISAHPGGGSVVIDGQDVSERVANFVVEAGAAGTVPQVTLVQFGPVDIEGEGVVTVVRDPDGGAVADAVVAFLEEIDPDVFVSVVESKFTSLGSSPIALALQTLIEVAKEATD